MLTFSLSRHQTFDVDFDVNHLTESKSVRAKVDGGKVVLDIAKSNDGLTFGTPFKSVRLLPNKEQKLGLRYSSRCTFRVTLVNAGVDTANCELELI